MTTVVGTNAERVDYLTCLSEVVAEVTVEETDSYLTTNGGWILSDYRLKVHNVIKASPPGSVKAGSDVYLIRYGGRATVNGRTVTMPEFTWLRELGISLRYLAFLASRVESTGGYRTEEAMIPIVPAAPNRRAPALFSGLESQGPGFLRSAAIAAERGQQGDASCR